MTKGGTRQTIKSCGSTGCVRDEPKNSLSPAKTEEKGDKKGVMGKADCAREPVSRRQGRGKGDPQEGKESHRKERPTVNVRPRIFEGRGIGGPGGKRGEHVRKEEKRKRPTKPNKSLTRVQPDGKKGSDPWPEKVG